MSSLVGRALALAAHPICREADPNQAGLKNDAILALLAEAELEVGGRDRPQVLRTALNNAQDLFRVGPDWTWVWVEPVEIVGEVLSGVALAEEAYRLMTRHDPLRAGLHYQAVRRLLAEDGVIIRGPNQGKTVFTSLNSAKHLFEWVKSGTFRWK